jgi:hypothetical protein
MTGSLLIRDVLLLWNTGTEIAELSHFNVVRHSYDSFQLIYVSMSQLICFHETFKTDIQFIIRSYAAVTSEDGYYKGAYTRWFKYDRDKL